MSPLNKSKTLVLAIGGNSLIKDAKHQTVPDQFAVTRETARHIARMIQSGWSVVITHGNGPQVGFILRRTELALHELHAVPLDSIGADTQGAIGYMIQQCLQNEFRSQGIPHQTVTIVTQVRVDANDPAFADPSKPIGSFMDEKIARQRAEQEGWVVKDDAGRGWRRVVASPQPLEILELYAIAELVGKGCVVIAVGGGGIPVVRDAAGNLKGIAAVIDKDLASALLAEQLGVDTLLISTGVEKICLDYRKPSERSIAHMTLSEARRYLAEGQFPKGSMGPKIQAIIQFLERGGKRAIVTAPENLAEALEGQAGTQIVLG